MHKGKKRHDVTCIANGTYTVSEDFLDTIRVAQRRIGGTCSIVTDIQDVEDRRDVPLGQHVEDLPKVCQHFVLTARAASRRPPADGNGAVVKRWYDDCMAARRWLSRRRYIHRSPFPGHQIEIADLFF